MDTKKDCKIPECGVEPLSCGQKMVVGAKQLKKAILADRAKWVYLAEDADPRVTEPLEEMCSQRSIHYTWVARMADLGSACGIEVGAAAAAVVG